MKFEFKITEKELIENLEYKVVEIKCCLYHVIRHAYLYKFKDKNRLYADLMDSLSCKNKLLENYKNLLNAYTLLFAYNKMIHPLNKIKYVRSSQLKYTWGDFGFFKKEVNKRDNNSIIVITNGNVYMNDSIKIDLLSEISEFKNHDSNDVLDVFKFLIKIHEKIIIDINKTHDIFFNPSQKPKTIEIEL